jgi:hypothetical protein
MDSPEPSKIINNTSSSSLSTLNPAAESPQVQVSLSLFFLQLSFNSISIYLFLLLCFLIMLSMYQYFLKFFGQLILWSQFHLLYKWSILVQTPTPVMSLSTELCLRSINVSIIILRSIQYIANLFHFIHSCQIAPMLLLCGIFNV